MKLGAITPRVLIFQISLGVSILLFIFETFTPLTKGALEKTNLFFIESIFSSGKKTASYDQEKKELTVNSLVISPQKGNALQVIYITDDPKHIFESSPPSALDYAVILHKLHQKGFKNVILGIPLTWDYSQTNEDNLPNINLSLKALDAKLAEFNHSVIALPMTRGATDQDLPAAFQRSLIPYNQTKGDLSALPKVNQISLPSNISGGEHSHAGFSSIDTTPSDEKNIPLLAQWQDKGIIPSFALLALCNTHNIQIKDIHITAEQDIQLGKNGPLIPIDEFGQTPIPSSKSESICLPSPHAINAEDLIQHSDSLTSNKSTSCLILAKGEHVKSSHTLKIMRANQLRILSQTLPTPSNTPTTYQRASLWYDFLFLLIIALSGSLFSIYPHKIRHLTYFLTFLFTLISLLFLMEFSQTWFGITLPAIGIIISWLLSFLFNKQSINTT